MASGGEYAHTFAAEAVRRAVMAAEKWDADFSPDKVTAVIAATITSEYACPSVACILQRELGLPEHIMAFDISAACTGFVYALQTANALLASREDGYIIVAGTECLSRHLDFKDRSTCILFGDGAGAAVLKRDPSPDAVFLECSGTRGNTEDLYCRTGTDGFVRMNGRAVFRFAANALREALDTLLEKSGSTMDRVSRIVCHQANARIIEAVRRRYPGYEDRFFMDLETIANTSAASVAIALADMDRRGLLAEGETIIAAAFGAGLSWSAVMMTL